jgi:hypothetical protein
MTRIARTLSQACLLVALGAVAAEAAPNNGSGPTQAQIDCHNRATNDYFDQTKACQQSLGDLPAELRQCIQDAFDDMNRRQAACKSAAKVGGVTKLNPAVLNGGVFKLR